MIEYPRTRNLGNGVIGAPSFRGNFGKKRRETSTPPTRLKGGIHRRGVAGGKSCTEEMAAEAVARRTTRSKTNATEMMPKSFSDMMSFRNTNIAGHRTKRLHRSNKNTVPAVVTTSCIGTALIGVKSQISPNLFDGIEIRKLSKRGTIVPRVLTLSDDLYKIIVSHPMGVREVESVIDLIRYKSIETVHIKRIMRTIDVSDLLFVQSGFVGSRRLEACTSDCLDPAKVITIFYKNFKTMDILMDNEEDVSAVLHAIQLIRETYDTAKNKFARETLLLRYVWNDIDWKKSGLIKQSDFLQLLRRINVYIKKEKAIQIFKQYITAKRLKKGSTGRTTAGSMRRVSMTTIHRQNGITFDECLDALKQVKLKCTGRHLITDIIFNELFGDKTDVVTTEEFMEKFLRQKQKEHNVTLENTRRIFSKLNNIEIVGSYTAEGSMDRLRFGEYVFSSWNDGFDPEIQQFDSGTLTRPFPSYWINSSHNTYLTADQFQSESSVQMYVVALQRGCKCVELDCWDDQNINQPVVYHGYTMTSKILFQSIISCIKNYIDVVNPDTLPIVLSLENHCSPHFQQMMSTILSSTLGDRIYIHDEGFTTWPSPLDLVGKVLLKGGQCQKENDNNDLNSLERNKSQSPRSETFKCPSTALGISRMTVLNTVEFRSFTSSFDLPSTVMHSVDETKFLKILNNDPSHVLQWKQFNTAHMTRIYPHGSRMDSSNYNPLVAWAMGIQLVALNFQTDDSAMTINDGRFRVCGGCGYVLKPPSVLSQFRSDDRMQLRIKILSASILPKAYGGAEVADPYVIVRLHDVQNSDTLTNDLKLKSAKYTSIIRANGFCAEWNDADFFEFLVESVSVAMLEIIVMNNDEEFIDDIICKTALPVSCLRQGYRSIQFYDNCSRQQGLFGLARLLVEVKFELLESSEV